MKVILNLFTEIIGAVIIFGAGWIMSNIIIRRRKNSLKTVLGIQDSSETGGARVITPVYHKELDVNLMHHKDGVAVSCILTLLHEIGVGSQIVAYHQISSDSQESPRDSFIIASPISNSKTEEYLKKYCPRFLVIDERDEEEKKSVPSNETEARFEDGRLKYGIRISAANQLHGAEDKQLLEFPIYQENDYAVLIKIDPNISVHNKTTHLLFGLSATGTAAAAYYLSKHYKAIYDEVEDKSYCLLVKFDRKEGYKHVSRDFINLSDRVIGM